MTRDCDLQASWIGYADDYWDREEDFEYDEDFEYEKKRDMQEFD